MKKELILKNHKETNYTIIWLHGLGADGNDFKDIIQHLKLKKDIAHIKFIFPHADFKKITINNGMEMRAWYDIKFISNLDKYVNNNQILESVLRINNYVEDEIKNGTKPENILLMGFSQGGVIASYSALLQKHNLAGVISLSSYLPDFNFYKHKIINNDLKFKIAHGIYDEIISIDMAKLAKRNLERQKIQVEFVQYEMGHAMCIDEIKKIRAWILELLKV